MSPASRLRVPLFGLALAVGPMVVSVALAAGSTGGHAALPKLAPTMLPAPEPTAAAELDAALAQIGSGKDADVKAGLARLDDGGAALVPAMGRKLAELRKSANRDLMGVFVGEARKGKSKKDDDDDGAKKKKKKKDDDGDGETRDWLQLVLAKPHAAEVAYRDLTSILAMERALAKVGSTPATRALVDVFFYFGDLFRVDVQLLVAKLGDRAVPALLEAKKHDVEKVRRWAAKQLDVLGRAIPGEAVQVADPEILADVLRAYGRAKEIDALRVVVSFTSSDRAHVRDAAREALVSYGEAGLWMLREALESATGKRPPAGTPWDKLAADLFEAHDRARLEEIIATFEDGLAKHKEGKLDEMATAFDSVLARAPTFERRAEMAAGYLELAKKLDGKDDARALLYARKALRIDPQSATARATESYVLTLEGERLLSHGLAETAAFKRAIEVDPSNDRAKSDLSRIESNPRARTGGAYRYLAAAAIGLLAAIAAFVVGVWRRAPAT